MTDKVTDAVGAVSFQERVQPWMMECFGPEIAADRLERSDRFIEEALELVQASGYDQSRAHALVDYVYGRPQGDINQEVGGVMVTLAAHCLAHGVDMHEAAETELARIWTKVEQIRAKQAAKPTGSALPVALAMHEAKPDGDAVERAAQHLMATRRVGTASVNEEQRDADNIKMLEAYRDIIGKAAPFFASPPPVKDEVIERDGAVEQLHAKVAEADRFGARAESEWCLPLSTLRHLLTLAKPSPQAEAQPSDERRLDVKPDSE